MDNTNEKPKEVYDIPGNVSAYDFFSQSGFNFIREGDYDTFIVGGVGYRFLIPPEKENTDGLNVFWWKSRIEELPVYVQEKFGKVFRAAYRIHGVEMKCFESLSEEFPFKWTHIFPATKEDYDNYINSKK